MGGGPYVDMSIGTWAGVIQLGDDVGEPISSSVSIFTMGVGVSYLYDDTSMGNTIGTDT